MKAAIRVARSQLLKRQKALAVERDRLRALRDDLDDLISELRDDLDDLITSCDDAEAGLETAIEALSRYV